jgi:hypothetical protein
MAALLRAPGQRRRALARLDHVLHLDEPARTGWLRRHRPDPADRDRNWWLYYLEMIDSRLAEQPDRLGALIALKLWLLDQGQAQGSFDPMDTAMRRAWSVTMLHSRHAPLPAEVRALLPTAEDLVKACLDAIPGTRETLARRDRLGTLTHPQMLHSRQARSLVHAAEYHRSRLHDPALVEELARWSAIRAELV